MYTCVGDVLFNEKIYIYIYIYIFIIFPENTVKIEEKNSIYIKLLN
jgi:hypothetical protein